VDTAEIIAVGNELLAGTMGENNCVYLSRRLSELGYNVSRAAVLPDDWRVVADEVRRACRRSNLVITTGGLGPTTDDVTRKAVFTAMGCSVIFNKEVMKNIIEKFRSIGKKMPVHYRALAKLPEGAEIYLNPVGAAPGIGITGEDFKIILLPGVPAEMRRMFESKVLPSLNAPGGPGITRIRLFGLSETEVEDRVKNIVDLKVLEALSIISSPLGVDIYIPAGVVGEGEIELIEVSLQDYIYTVGDSEMEEEVVKLLEDSDSKLVTAESVTGGLLASRIISIPGASKVYSEGSIVYSNKAKVTRLGVNVKTIKSFGTVSTEVCVEMAEGARNTSGADYSLATTGIAGPEGGTDEKPVGLCYVALGADGVSYCKKMILPGDRNMIRFYVSTAALDMLRLKLLGIKERLISFKHDS
jgi:nicotinamide-nucleotide amidase